MSREEIYERLNTIFQDVFDDELLTVNSETTAADVEGWDSLTHIYLIGAIEDDFSIRLKMRDIVGLSNVGDLVELIENTI